MLAPSQKKQTKDGADKEEEEKKQKEEPKKKSMCQGNLSLEQAEVGGKPMIMCVFRSPFGQTLYSGTVSAKHSKYRKIEEKTYKLQFKIALMNKVPKEQRFQIDHCVVSFSRNDDLSNFEKEFVKALEVLKKGEE